MMESAELPVGGGPLLNPKTIKLFPEYAEKLFNSLFKLFGEEFDGLALIAGSGFCEERANHGRT